MSTGQYGAHAGGCPRPHPDSVFQTASGHAVLDLFHLTVEPDLAAPLEAISRR